MSGKIYKYVIRSEMKQLQELEALYILWHTKVYLLLPTYKWLKIAIVI